MKTCSNCNEIKIHERFYRSAASSDGYKARCKDCDRSAKKDTGAEVRYRERNRAALAKRTQTWRQEHADKARITNSKYRANNPAKLCAIWATRRASKHQRTPRWLSSDHKQQIREIYVEARMKGLVVDHIVPLHGKHVCGLHVPWNLQHLTAEANLQKSNKY